jgi:hypothetical protein
LIVLQTPKNQQLVEKVLREMAGRMPTTTPVRLRVLWLLVDETVAAEYSVAKPAPPARFKEDLQQSLHFVSELCCRTGQKVHLLTGDQRPYVVQRRSILSEESEAAAPVTRSLQLGLAFEARAMLDPSQSTGRLQLEGHFADSEVWSGQAFPDVAKASVISNRHSIHIPLKVGEATTVVRMSYRPNDPGDVPRQLVLVAQLFVEAPSQKKPAEKR